MFATYSWVRTLRFVVPGLWFAVWITSRFWHPLVKTPLEAGVLIATCLILYGLLALWILSEIRAAEGAVDREGDAIGFADAADGPAWEFGVENAQPFSLAQESAVFARRMGLWHAHPAGVGLLTSALSWSGVRFRVAWIRLPKRLPPLEVFRPRAGHGGRWGRELGSTSSEFEDAFHVQCRDLSFARAILTPTAIERVLAEGQRCPPFAIDGDVAFTFARGRVWHRGQVARHLSLLSELADSIAPSRWGVYGTDPNSWEPAPPKPPPWLASLRAEARSTDWVDTRKQNWLGRIAILCVVFVWSAPIGVLLGHLGLRAARRGVATNRRMALTATILGYVVTIAAALLFVFFGG